MISYKCNHGFMLVGNGTRVCGSDQTWSGEDPECQVMDLGVKMIKTLVNNDFQEINCGLPGPNRDGIIPNGWIEHSRTTLNAVITFRYKPFHLQLRPTKVSTNHVSDVMKA